MKKTCLFCLTALLLTAIVWTGKAAAQEFTKRYTAETRMEESGSTPTDTWVIRLAEEVDPREFARRQGLEYSGPVGELKGYYLFIMPEDKDGMHLEQTLKDTPEVLWFEQQYKRQRFKRVPEDPLFDEQWHLNNSGQTGGTIGVDVNVLPAWDKGFKGNGVQIAIVDDGLQYTHPDLADNYVSEDSWDYFDDNSDPYPRGANDDHGTAVAGVAAARDDGQACGVGVAYRAGLSGIRLIAGSVTDAQKAQALTHHYHNNHIYNNSWGPQDDGQRLEGPETLTSLALEDGINNGRSGLGSIYVWAGGNGLANNDNINYDGYANSRYTIAVGAVDHNGRQTRYAEPGAPMLVTAPSSNLGVGITTTDRMSPRGYNSRDNCTAFFRGTSSSAPLVSGTVALMLEANPDLTWRDVQHILLRSTVRNDPDDGDWVQNGAGKWINHKYGFGMVDAYHAVSLASQWPGSGLARTYDTREIQVNEHVPADDPQGVSSSVNVSKDLKLEHVEVIFSSTHPYRGDLEIELTSPDGTKSVLAELRADFSPDYEGWKFMSVRHWGETSKGTWSIRVADIFPGDDISGTFDSWQLVLHGTAKGERIIRPISPGILHLLLGDG